MPYWGRDPSLEKYSLHSLLFDVRACEFFMTLSVTGIPSTSFRDPNSFISLTTVYISKLLIELDFSAFKH